MPIRGNESFKELADEVVAFEAFAKLRPIIRLLGKPGRELAEALDAVPELAQAAREFAELPDRFNAHYRPRGWIAYEEINEPVMRKAVELADAGDLDAGEHILIENLDRATVHFGLMRVRRLEPFRLRERLLMLAVEDHLAGRFHASVPVLLAQMDGIIRDLTGQALYEHQTKKLKQLIVSDSIAGHSESVVELVATILATIRMRTTTDPLTLPYRHGILHGRDLGYDNELVSAKCLRLLLALCSLASKLDSKRLKEEVLIELPEQRPVTWRDFVKTMQEHAERQARTYLDLPSTMANEVVAEQDISRSSKEPQIWIPGLPARSFAQYLHTLGFECKPPTRGQTMLFWACTWKSGAADYRVDIMGRDATHFRSVTAMFLHFGSEANDEPAHDFLGFVATIPYHGAKPERARQWVISSMASGGEITIGSARLILSGRERMWTLKILGLGISPHSRIGSSL